MFNVFIVHFVYVKHNDNIGFRCSLFPLSCMACSILLPLYLPLYAPVPRFGVWRYAGHHGSHYKALQCKIPRKAMYILVGNVILGYSY